MHDTLCEQMNEGEGSIIYLENNLPLDCIH